MVVKQVELSSIEARRFSKPNERMGQVRIDHNSTVTLVKELTPQEANVEFRYTASYGGIGIIRLEGSLNFTCDAKAMTAKWQETAQMPGEVASEIHTAVMRVCVPEAVGIAKTLNLPPPIPLPQVRFDEPQGQGTKTLQPGSVAARHESPEVA